MKEIPHRPTHEEIAVAAYYIWLHQEQQNMYHPWDWQPVLSAEHNWALAEQQLLNRWTLDFNAGGEEQ